MGNKRDSTSPSKHIADEGREMDAIVLMKQVPDTAEVKLDPVTGTLLREGVKSIINPDDRHALEAALRLKEKSGGKVTVISMGPPQAIDAVTEALGMGADDAILLTDRFFAGADTWATSTTLGKAIRATGKFDLLLCGRQAIDGDTAQVGPQIAEYLSIPQVTYVFEVEEVCNHYITVKRRLEDGYERVECRLPALISVIREINCPRHPRMDLLINACKENAPVKILNAADIGLQTHEIGLEGSWTQVIKTFAPKVQRRGELIEGNARIAASQLVGRLRENKIV